MALRTYQQMTVIGISPDATSIDAVVSAFYAVGVSRSLLLALWAYIQPFPGTLRNTNPKALDIRFRTLHDLPPRDMKLSKS